MSELAPAASPAGIAPQEPVRGLPVARRGRALAVLYLVLFLTFLDTTIVAVALSSVQSNLHAGVSDLQWVVNAYALVFASLMLVLGTLGDRLGRKKVMVVGLGVFCAGSLLAALAPNPDLLIAGRAVMGAGAAASEPGTLSLLRHLYPESRTRAKALGGWAAISGLALALGPVIGGALVGAGGWRAVFFANLAFGVVILTGALVSLPESADRTRARPDAAGFVLSALSLAALVFAVTIGETSGYGTAPPIVLFCVALVALVGFVLVERASPAPLLDLHLFADRSFAGALVGAFVVFFGIFSIFFFTALYLQSVVGYSPYRTAAAFGAMAVTMILASLWTGHLVASIGPRVPMVLGCLLAAAGVGCTDAVLQNGVPLAALICSLALCGVGFGMAMVPVTSVALGAAPPEHSGMVASATNTSRELGAVIGVAVLGALVNGQLTNGLQAKLHHLGIPNAFQAIVIHAVETGQVNASPGAEKAYGSIVDKVIGAAYAAFRSGLDIALLTATIALALCALIAWLSVRGGRPTPVAPPFATPRSRVPGSGFAGSRPS